MNILHTFPNAVTPWGLAQHVSALDVSGCVAVSTASHGGYLVTRKVAQARIPLKILDSLFTASGQYLGEERYAFEEDCDAMVFFAYFPECLEQSRRSEFIEMLGDMLLDDMLSSYNPELRAQYAILSLSIASQEA